MSKPMNHKVWIGILATLTVATLGASRPAEAREHGREFRHVDWGHGRWVHDRHGGRLGWWWVVGPAWYFYERPHTFVVQPSPPVVVQQAPSVVVVPQSPPQAPPVTVAPPPPPSSPVLYYCKATGTHYPETMSCPGGWMTMTAETPPQPVPGNPVTN